MSFPPESFRITREMTALGVYDGAGQNWNKIVLAVEIPLMVLAIIVVGLRVYSRIAIKKQLAVDDILILCGCACAVARTVISCISADDNWGYDSRGPDRAVELPYYQHIFERRIAYIFSASFTRCSVVAYYLRIFPPGLVTLRRWSWVLLFLGLAEFVEVLTVLLVMCREIGKLWSSDWMTYAGSHCFSSARYSYSAAIGDSILDSLIFALPIPYVWRLSRLRTRQRLGLIVVFALGLVVCVVALLQIPFIKKREESTAYFGGAINMLIAIQLSLAIVAASLPDLRALIARSFPKFSPLHHRSLNTNHQAGARDVEIGSPDAAHGTPHTLPDEKRTMFRRPDWMRSEIPASLLSTRVTRADGASDEFPAPRPQMSRRKSSVVFPWVTQSETLPTPLSENVPPPGRALSSTTRRTSLASGGLQNLSRRPSLAVVLEPTLKIS